MGLFGSLFSGKPAAGATTAAAPAVVAPAGPAMPAAVLPHLDAPSAAPLVAKAGITPPAGIGAPNTMSSSAYVQALAKGGRPVETVSLLAHGLPDQYGVQWAAASCDSVANKLSPSDQAAATAAKKWLSEPTPANQALAGKAAAAAGHQGPGAWAAQAAAWSKIAAPAAPGATAPAGASPLVAKAVSGSVMLAAGLSTQKAMAAPAVPTIPTVPTLSAPKMPTAAAPSAPALPAVPATPPVDVPTPAMINAYKPFIEKGIAIAAGK